MRIMVQAVMVRTADGRYVADPLRSIYAEVPAEEVAKLLVKSGLVPKGAQE